jgi:hypothetical protein
MLPETLLAIVNCTVCSDSCTAVYIGVCTYEHPLVQLSLDTCQHPTLLSLASYPPVIKHLSVILISTCSTPTACNSSFTVRAT